MKKMIAVILIFVFLFPAASFGVTVRAWMIEGSWNHFEYTDDGMLLTSMYLDESGKAYFVTQLFHADDPGLGRAFVGSWEFTGEDTIHVITGNNSSLDLTYCTYNMMFDYSTGSYFFRAELKDDDKVK